jgi:glycosyltransferase involved in cell wall biosynthesis
MLLIVNKYIAGNKKKKNYFYFIKIYLDKYLHIVCFDIPYPANYGGVIDVFYQIKNLHQLGVQIKLHCFMYGNRTQQSVLEKYCTAVYYYPRKSYWRFLFSSVPFIIGSRKSNALLKNLLQDEHPILFEAIHCAAFVGHPLLANRKKVLRTLNIEHEYYRQLASHEKNILKKIYYLQEAKRLLHYETTQLNNVNNACITKQDADYFSSIYGVNVIKQINAFHPNHQVNIKIGLGQYCLYHGNLSVAENETAALWLIDNVFRYNTISLVIAGANPSATLIQKAQKFKTKLIANPSNEQLQQLLQDAQINVLPSFQTTGIKLKLLHALCIGRHCIVNAEMVASTGLQDACTIAKSYKEWQQNIEYLFYLKFTQQDIQARTNLLQTHFNNTANATLLWQMLI